MGKAEETKQFIIEQTAQLFNKKGYAGTSLSDLTAATGLTKGAIYGNFSDKEDVAIAALDYNIKRLWEKMVQKLDKYSSAKEKLFAYLDFYQENFSVMILNGGCAYMNSAIDSDDAQPKIFEQVRKNFAQWHTQVAQLVGAGIENGELKPGTNKDAVADLIISTIEGSILLSKTMGSNKHMVNNIRFLKGYIHTLGAE